MDSRYAWLFGGGVAFSLGYVFGLQRGHVWIGGMIVVVWTIAGYGFLAFPEHRRRRSGSRSRFWYSLISMLGPIVMLVPPNSPLLLDVDGVPLTVLLGGVWFGGVFGGIALERRLAESTDN